jgi:pantothenate synthetase
MSIYINPTQFAQGEDLNTYPQTIKSDLDKLSNYKIDCAFLPGNTEMYPDGINTGNYNNNLVTPLKNPGRLFPSKRLNKLLL